MIATVDGKRESQPCPIHVKEDKMSIDKDSMPESLRTRSSIDIGEAKAQETPVERAEFQLNHSPYETDIPALCEPRLKN